MVVAKFIYPEGEVAVVEVRPSLVPPVRYKGKVCIRIGPRKGTANEAEERILSEKRSTFARSFDTQPAYESELEDISIDIFKIVYNKNDYRNPTLAEAAKNLGFINSFNVGVKRATAALQRNGSPEPVFILDQLTSFGVIIYKRI